MPAPDQPATAPTDPDSWVPDFCRPEAALTVVVSAQLLALALTLAPGSEARPFWASLAGTSLFVQWVALLSAAALCAARRQLAQLPPLRAALLAFLLVQFITLAVTLLPLVGSQWIPALALLAVQGDPVTLALRHMALAGIVTGVVLRVVHLQYAARRSQQRRTEARIEALQARIRPHFLFNSLNTIVSLIESDPELAEQATENLAQLFRASLGDANQLVPLADELQLCRQYLAIESLRLGQRLQIEWQIGALPITARIPALTLQPLLENAVYHGVEPLPEPGTIRISASADAEERVTVIIDNPVASAGAGTGATRESGHGLALANTAERLQAHFGPAAALTSAQSDDRFVIRLTIPGNARPDR